MRSLKISHVAREREKEKKRPKKGFEWKNRIHALLRKLMLHFCSAINICIGLFAFVSFALKIVDVKKIRYKYCGVGSPKICDFLFFLFFLLVSIQKSITTQNDLLFPFFYHKIQNLIDEQKSFQFLTHWFHSKLSFHAEKNRPEKISSIQSKMKRDSFAQKKIRNSFLFHKLFD